MAAREEEEEAPWGRQAGCQARGRRSSACNCANTNAAKANFTEFHSADSSLSQDSSAWEISSLEMEKKKLF